MIYEGLEGREGREKDWGVLDAEEVSRRAIGFAIKVHKTAGPGLFEHIYEDCMSYELSRSGLCFERQVVLPLICEGVRLGRAYKGDIAIEKSVLIEIKLVESISPIHKTQTLTYLRLSGCRIGLLMNFNCGLLKEGLHRLVA